MERRNAIFAYCMVAIGFVHFCIFYVYLNFNSILLAFQVPLADGGQQFSFFNFQKLFNELTRADTQIYNAFLNTMKYFVLGIVKLFTTFLVSYFIYKKVPLYKAYRIIFFLPSIIPSIVMVTVFKNFVSTYGPLWTILYDVFGYDMPSLLTRPETATATIMFYVFWSGFGVQMLMYTGVMTRIPVSMVEYAKLDGVSPMREFFYLTLPLIYPTISTFLVVGVANFFIEQANAYNFYGPQAPNAVQTIGYYLFVRVVGPEATLADYPFASAAAVVFTLIAAPVTLFAKWILGKFEPTVEY